tara:strand:+ start:85 stop:1833 length:1749 start_codon:yes stop_codon:yes gene_type:complete
MDDDSSTSSALLEVSDAPADDALELQKRDGRLCFKQRFLFAALAFLGLVNVYAMRVNLSVAILPMSNQFGWNDGTTGLVLSTFFIGYMFGQVPGGWIASKYGGKVVFGVGITATGVLTLLLPLAATGNLGGRGTVALGQNWPIYILRILMGFFESFTFPALYALLKEWVPDLERSFLVGIIMAGAQMGTIVSFPVSSYLVALGTTHSSSPGVNGTTEIMSTATAAVLEQQSGELLFCLSGICLSSYSLVFYFFGALGCLWALPWFLLVSNDPTSHRCISSAEREYIVATTESKSKTKETDTAQVPWLALLSHHATWAIFITHFASNWSLYTLLTWLPKFLKEAYSVDVKASAGLEVLPFAAMFLTGAVGGKICDLLVYLPAEDEEEESEKEEGGGVEEAGELADVLDKTVHDEESCPAAGALSVVLEQEEQQREQCCHCISLRAGRLLFQGMGSLVPALALVAITFANGPTLGIALMTVAVGFSGFGFAGYSSNVLDICPGYPSVLFGISNTIATIPGIISPYLTGKILGTSHSHTRWRIVFFIAAAIYVVAYSCWCVFMRATPQKVLSTRRRGKKKVNVEG